MPKRAHDLALGFLALAFLIGGAGCQKHEEGTGDQGAADTASLRDTTAAAPTSGAPVAPTDEVAQVSVTNAMPHPMIVKADWGEGENELGTVDPNETKSFDVKAPGGTQVTLTASDKDASHSTSGSVTVGTASPASWTIQ